MHDSLTNKYQLISKIGEGSFSEVLKVRDKKTGTAYAAKRLTKPFATLEDVEDYDELKTFRLLEYHPNVIFLVDYVYEVQSGSLSLIFNLMDMSLYDFIKDRKKKLSEKRCKNFIYQLLLGINYLHQCGIFHR